MKLFAAILGVCAVLGAAGTATAQDKPGALMADEVSGVVTVQEVDYENRTVTVEDADGQLVTIEVPEQAQNLYQVKPGAKFNVHYVRAVAVGVMDPGSEPSAEAAETMELAAKGANPGGRIVRVVQVSGKIVEINREERTIRVLGAMGKIREFAVSDAVKRFDELNVGDVVGLRVTEALAMDMIPQ